MSENILFLAHVSEAGDALSKSIVRSSWRGVKLRQEISGHLTIGLIGANVEAAAETIATAGAETNSCGHRA